MSPDLGLARIYLSFLLAKNNQLLLEEIEEKNKIIRNLLANRIRHQVRIIPQLQFFVDDTAEYAAQMTAIINALEIPPLKEGEVIEMD